MAVTGASVGNDGAKALATLPALEHLDLTQTNVGDEGMKALAGAKGLKTLRLGMRLGDRRVTETGVKALAGLDNLVALDLSGAHLWPKGPGQTGPDPDAPALAVLATLKNLEYLDLSSALLPRTGVKALAGLPKLRALNLENTATEVGGWGPVAGIKSMTWLRLAQVQGADLPALAGFKTLTVFQMNASLHLTDGDRLKLARDLPNCELSFRGGAGRMPWPETPLSRTP